MKTNRKYENSKAVNENSKSAFNSAYVYLGLLILGFAILITFGYIYKWELIGVVKYKYRENGTIIGVESVKTLWDWLELLIIPAVLAFGAIFFNRAERKNELRISEARNENEKAIAERRALTERIIAQDQLHEVALQDYLDHMSELLLEKHLRHSSPNSEIRNVARTKTLTTLRRLDPERKAALIQFLYESNLIIPNNEIISLIGVSIDRVAFEDAELKQISLRGATLRRANFTTSNFDFACLAETDLQEASFHATSLIGCDLSSATLSGAYFWGADLSNANLAKVFVYESNLKHPDKEYSTKIVADFTHASLNFANLQGASFINAIMAGVGLINANLENAYLRGTNLFAANLTGANLINADLTGVDLSFANLTGAQVHASQLLQAKSLLRTILPNGTVNE